GDGEELSEDLLAVPLWVHFPDNALAGTKVDTPTVIFDVARTILDVLHLSVPDGFEGTDLFAIARGGGALGARPLWAALGPSFDVRWGDAVLWGVPGRAPNLCDLSRDPGCEVDRLETMPIAARALWRFMYDAEADAANRRKGRPREPATVDANTSA